MKIISKRRAMTIYRQHPASRIFQYSTGRYQWHGSVCHYTGKVVPDIPGVLAVYAERRQGRSGISRRAWEPVWCRRATGCTT